MTVSSCAGGAGEASGLERSFGYNWSMPTAATARPAPDVPSPVSARAIRSLERALTRRRLRELDARLVAEIAMISLLLAAVLFWQVRVPLDGWAQRHSPLATAGVALALFAAVALVCGVVTLIALRRALSGARDGPEWMALPLEGVLVRRHLEWNARAALPFCLLAQFAIWIALVGLLSPWAMLALAAMALALTAIAAESGPALGLRLAVPGTADDPAALASALARSGRVSVSTTHSKSRWRASTPLATILAHDWKLTWRATPARARALIALAWMLGAALVWFAPWRPPICRFVALAFALLASAAAAEWLIEVTALHPFAALRTLPVGVGSFWGARLIAAAVIAVLITLAQGFGARLMDPLALRVHLVWTGLASLAVLLFGANLAVTLYPRGDHARRVLTLSLAIAVTASLILPLAGWVLLLTGVLHSARRLALWTRGEQLTCS
ncbi:MAG: hypothetical protein ACRENS_08255 [Candidatus Eiseniibacteriota bacterium]